MSKTIPSAYEGQFYEEQRFTQWWLRGPLLAVTSGMLVVFGYGIFKQLVFGQPWGIRPMSNIALVVVGSFAILLMVGITYLFFMMKLITEVHTEGLFIQFFPFSGQMIPYKNIKRCEARKYHPIKEYGGWGIRYSRKGKAYNVSGNHGLQLYLMNGKAILIGSQRSGELAEAIHAHLKRSHPD
jgi:Family of unknown function (DUF6141)